MMKPWIILAASVALLSACEAEKVEVMKSPCVGLEGSPCGPKRPVNDGWLGQYQAGPVLRS